MLPQSKFCWGPSISSAVTHHRSPHIAGDTGHSNVISLGLQGLLSARILLCFTTTDLHVPKVNVLEASSELPLSVVFSFW